MNEIITFISKLLVLIILFPWAYFFYFLLWLLPERFGLLTRLSIVFCYLLIAAIDIYLLSEGLINFLIFVLIPWVIILIGAYYFKDELKKRFKKFCEKLKNQ
jgi:hypothetical protein